MWERYSIHTLLLVQLDILAGAAIKFLALLLGIDFQPISLVPNKDILLSTIFLFYFSFLFYFIFLFLVFCYFSRYLEWMQ